MDFPVIHKTGNLKDPEQFTTFQLALLARDCWDRELFQTSPRRGSLPTPSVGDHYQHPVGDHNQTADMFHPLQKPCQSHAKAMFLMVFGHAQESLATVRASQCSTTVFIDAHSCHGTPKSKRSIAIQGEETSIPSEIKQY